MFYEKIAILTGVCALVAVTFGASPRDWTNEVREPVQHIFTNDKSLDVDDVNGTVEVIGDNGNTIRVNGERITRALDQAAIAAAKRDVTLDINEKDGIAQLYVNGPFRGNDHSSQDHGFHIHYDSRDYEVTYNLTIRVPHNTELRLRTVNGELKSAQTNGKFDVQSVNGGIDLSEIGGYGRISTVNGKANVTFRENPTVATDFKSVNGTLDIAFQPNLAADLHFKKLNGAVYTDFDNVMPLPSSAPSREQRGNRFAFRSDRSGDVRVGAGGPMLSFETVNGDIRIRKQGK